MRSNILIRLVYLSQTGRLNLYPVKQYWDYAVVRE